MNLPNIRIRRATAADLPAVYLLATAKELDAPNHQAAEKWWIRDFLKAKQPFFVAEARGRVVGFTLGECATGKVAIHHLTAVEPRWRRRGIGTALTKAFEREARRRGMTCVLMYVSGGRHWQRKMERIGYARGSVVREYQKFL